MKLKIIPVFLLITVFIGLNAYGQTTKIFTEADYDRATAMLNANTSKFIDNNISPRWLEDGRLWYRSLTETSTVYKLFDPKTKKLVSAETQSELFKKAGVTPTASLGSYTEIPSPDGKYLAFIKDWNLYLKEVATGTEIALTTDGIKDFGYATDNAGWRQSDRPILSWSPDSKKIATYKQDQRHINNMYLVKTTVGAPELKEWKYPLPGDSAIIRIHRVIIDISQDPKLIKLKMASDARRGTLCDDISCEGGFDDVAWSEDSQKLVFVSTSRDHKEERIRYCRYRNW